MEPGRLQVGRVAEAGERVVERGRRRERRRGGGSASTTAAHTSSGSDIRSSSPARRGTPRRSRDRARAPTSAPPSRPRHRAADGVEHHRGVADRREAGGLGDLGACATSGRRWPSKRSKPSSTARLTASGSRGGASAARRPRSPRALPPRSAARCPARDSTSASGPRRARARAGSAAPRPAASRRSGRRAPGRRCRRRRAPRRSRATSPHSRRSEAARRSRRRAARLVQPGAARELARQQAGAHRLARRMPAGQIARHRQGGDDAGDPDRLAHAPSLRSRGYTGAYGGPVMYLKPLSTASVTRRRPGRAARPDAARRRRSRPVEMPAKMPSSRARRAVISTASSSLDRSTSSTRRGSQCGGTQPGPALHRERPAALRPGSPPTRRARAPTIRIRLAAGAPPTRRAASRPCRRRGRTPSPGPPSAPRSRARAVAVAGDDVRVPELVGGVGPGRAANSAARVDHVVDVLRGHAGGPSTDGITSSSAPSAA